MKNVTESDFQALLVDIKKEFPDFEMIEKGKSRRMKALDVFLKIITLGQMRVFMTRFVTTDGAKVYVPDGWLEEESPASRMITMRHERVHMRQKARQWFGLVFTIAYILLWFPIGLAYFRKKWEMEAYEESFRAINEYWGESELRNEKRREHYVKHFTGPSYFWMWPFKKSVEKWYDEAIERIAKTGK
jgi:hypothetical protein